MKTDWKCGTKDWRATYFDSEPWYQREKTEEWYQQEETCNQAMRTALFKLATKESNIVEIGCGGGWLASYLQKIGIKSYTGIEYSKTAISNCLSKNLNNERFTFNQGSALSKDLYPEKADIVLAHQFIHCVIGNDRNSWYGICKSILKPANGKLLLSSMIGMPNNLKNQINLETRLNKPKNRIYLEDEQIQTELKTAGFVMESVIYPKDNYAQYLLSVDK